jgi:hypothetical protein
MIIAGRGSPCPARATRRVSIVTRKRVAETHGRRRCSGTRALVAAGALAAALAGPGEAKVRPLDARIVWAAADRVYIAAEDSFAVAPGDRVTVLRGRKIVASGEIVMVLTRDLAAARITSGSLARKSHLDRLSLVVEPRPLRAMPLLRIGYPGRVRGSLLFECGRSRVRPPHGGDAYRSDSLGADAFRLLRAVGDTSTLWPDTIQVRLFDDAVDEGIAIERGELDLAVFWPGEASSRLRTAPPWGTMVYGARGVLAGIALDDTRSWRRADPRGALGPGAPALAALNQEQFRGDLAPWRDPSDAAPPAPPAPASVDMQIYVDPSTPGGGSLNRFLERFPATGRYPVALRLFYLDAPAGAPDSLARAVARYLRNGLDSRENAARADTLELEAGRFGSDPAAPERVRRYLRDTLHVAYFFTVRCPILLDPGLRPYIRALGPDEIVGLLDCAAAGRAP